MKTNNPTVLTIQVAGLVCCSALSVLILNPWSAPGRSIKYGGLQRILHSTQTLIGEGQHIISAIFIALLLASICVFIFGSMFREQASKTHMLSTTRILYTAVIIVVGIGILYGSQFFQNFSVNCLPKEECAQAICSTKG